LLRQTAEYAAVPNVYAFRYLLYLPPGYNTDATATWPLMVFLHGSGERGTNVELVAVHGPPMLIEQGRDFPCIVVSPQCASAYWDAAALEAFIEGLASRYRIDPDRIYVTGLSMGGYGTWALAERNPDLYAAVVPICGGGNLSLAYRLRDLPVWAFHGALDTTVPLSESQNMIDAIRAAGGNPRFTIYPTADHVATWTAAYADDALYAWLFAQSRANLPPTTPPVIGTQPTSGTVTAGENATFTVATGGNPAPVYQWQRRPAGSTTWEDLHEGGSYHGVASATLMVSAATAAMAGDQFRCVVTNVAGSVASAAAILTVSAPATLVLQYPAGIAADAAGNLYVADAASNTIRKITIAGAVSTLAGSAGVAGSQDGTGSAGLQSAQFNQPGGVAIDGSGNVYVADTGNATIRKITPAGAVSTLAGSPTSRGSQDGAGGNATFNQPGGIAVDGAGNLYVADSFNATIRKITSTGVVTTLAGSPTMRGDADGTGAAARFNFPSGVAVDATGNVYVADTYNDIIRKIAPDGTVTTLAGSAGISGDNDGTSANALFNQPYGVAVDGSGNVYVADTANATIRKIAPDGAVTTFAGVAGVAGLGNGTGSASQQDALFNQPHGLVFDSAGNIYVADTGNGAIRRIAPDGTVTTLALMATPTDTTTPPPSGGTTPQSGTGTASGSSGGGGAMEVWLVAALALLATARRVARPR
jgi:sugar lactone lactonase YvrE/predicted esterase